MLIWVGRKDSRAGLISYGWYGSLISMLFPLVSILWILEVIGVSLTSEFLPLKLLGNEYSYSILATQQTGQFSFQLKQLIQK